MKMTCFRRNARFAGVMFLLAMAASLSGGFMIEAVIKPEFFIAVQGNEGKLELGIILEFINALAIIGIAPAMGPVLSRERPAMTAWYLGVRILESASCIAAAFMPIVMLGLIKQGANADTELFAKMLTMMRDTATAYMIPLFFAASAMFLYIMLYQLKLGPRYISIWGLIATVGIVAVQFLPEIEVRPLLAMPIILNEIYLGSYLFMKGFKAKSS
jgi:hypothetical protein